ncbi:hypothetical protein [Pedobacter sp. ASV28]|uniref:hypothetical protein n=1 Tax=Pedobacter sp. ASV28 TaxID=2795123 RepID=UPI0018EC94F7|nr:hypothetical protein [Pedobacter sp. ASV28]
MDLQQEWQQMSAEILKAKQNELVSKFTLDNQSKSLLQDLAFKLKWKLRWIRIIDLPILALALFAERDLKMVLIGIFVLYEVFRLFAVLHFRKIKTSIDYSSSTKQVLEGNLKAITKILAIENLWGYVVAPIAAPIGLLCYQLTVHKTFDNITTQSNFLTQVYILIPIGILIILLGRVMNRSIFKKPVADLKMKIEELS